MLQWLALAFSFSFPIISAILGYGYQTEEENPLIKNVFVELSMNHFAQGVTLISYQKNSSENLEITNFLCKILSKSSPIEISNENYKKPDWNRLMFRLDVSKASNIIIVLSDIGKVEDVIRQTREVALWSSQANIVIISKIQLNFRAAAIHIFDTFWKVTKSRNILFVSLHDGNQPKLSINLPYHDCSNGNFITIDIFNEKAFPNKVPEQFGWCDFTVATVTKEPYVLDPREPLQYYEGVEMRLLQAIAKSKKFTLKFKESPKGENPYLVYDRFNRRVGLLGLLYRQEADIACFGVGMGNDRYYAADALYPHTEDTLVWVVPSPQKKSNWDSVYIGFSIEIWVTIFASFIAIAVAFKLLANDASFLNLSKCFLDSLSATLNLGVSFVPTSSVLKIFVTTVLIYGIVITSAYQSLLVTLLTTQRKEKGFRVIEEAVNKGLLAYMFPSGMYMYNQSKHDMWNKILSDSGHVFETNYTFILQKIGGERNSLSLMIKNAAEYIVRRSYMTDSGPLVQWINPYFTNYPVTCYMAPGHPLTEEFNKNIRRLVEGGIPATWLRKILDNAENKSVFFASNDNSHKRLSFENLEITLVILGTGILSSLVMFIIEICIYASLNSDGVVIYKKD